MIGVEKHLCHFICSLVVLKGLIFDCIIESLQGRKRERDGESDGEPVIE